jgi:hypothetical protein
MSSPKPSFVGDSDYDDDDTISDISFDDVGEYYDRDDVIVARRTSSFAATNMRTSGKADRTPSEGVASPSSEISKGHSGGATSKQGTIRGVLIPCLQSNMLGAMLFMRLPWITSQTGVYLALLTFVLCLGSTLLTLLSLVAIATNGKLKKSGGLYVFVRKFLGLELGGSIGMLHLLQKILSVSMHCLAASEAILHGFALQRLAKQEITILAVLMCFVMSLILVLPKMEKRVDDISTIILGISAFTVLSFAVGAIAFACGSWNGQLSSMDRTYNDNWRANYDHDQSSHIAPSFFTLLSLYYASSSGLISATTRAGLYFFVFLGCQITKIMWCVGFLIANPSRSIPLGSFASVAIVSVIMIFIIFVCGLDFSHTVLRTDKFVLAAVAWPLPALAQAGIATGCIGVAMANLKGIPRLIGILDNDGAVPFFRFLQSQNRHSHHNIAIKTHVFVFFAVSLPCLTGNLNILAPYAAMPSLLAHVSVNLSCFLMAVVNNPNFRPNWQYFRYSYTSYSFYSISITCDQCSWHTALLGFLWCLAMMLLMSWWLSMLYILLLLVLMTVISHSTARNDWGDALSGLFYQQVLPLIIHSDVVNLLMALTI